MFRRYIMIISEGMELKLCGYLSTTQEIFVSQMDHLPVYPFLPRPPRLHDSHYYLHHIHHNQHLLHLYFGWNYQYQLH